MGASIVAPILIFDGRKPSTSGDHLACLRVFEAQQAIFAVFHLPAGLLTRKTGVSQSTSKRCKLRLKRLRLVLIPSYTRLHESRLGDGLGTN